MNDDEVYPTPPVAPPVTAPVALVTMEIRHPATDSLTESTEPGAQTPARRSLADRTSGTGHELGDGGPRCSPNTDRGALRPLRQPRQHGCRLDEDPSDRHRDHQLHHLRGFVRRCDAGRGRSHAGLVDSSGWNASACAMSSRSGFPVGVDGRVEWSNWIAEPLLGPQRIAPDGLSLTEWQGAAVYREPQPGKSLIVRYGPGFGQALDANYHLRRVTPVQPGPFFLMDIDSFWTPSGSIPEYNRDEVLSTYQALYESGSLRLSGDAHQPHEGRPASP